MLNTTYPIRAAKTAAPTALTMTRTQAARLIEEIREAVAGEHVDSLKLIALALSDAGLHALEACPGEAHQTGPGMIDNCTCCAPRWGWVGPKLTIR